MTELFENDYFENLRKNEYARLDTLKQTYLDFTGGNLFGISQLNRHRDVLTQNILGNPHSINPTSQKASELVDEARRSVINYFNAQDYVCVFTQNASGALKIVGESYPFCEDSVFVLLSDNHNSVNGIRSYCNHKGGETVYVPVQVEDLRLNNSLLNNLLEENKNKTHKLFAFPAQSNVSGVKHNLKWIKIAQDLGYHVLLDAAAFVPTSKLDLSKYQPDFVSISFYKIFGYPTGIGCLLIHKNTYRQLEKPWFAGGTVKLVSVAVQGEVLEEGHERFEDGTVNYLGIPAIKIGLDFIQEIGIEKINLRVKSLTEYLLTGLQSLKHKNGRSLVKIFGPLNSDHRGGNVIFNCYDPEGQTHAFENIELYANNYNLSIRSGCFCNPGLDEINSCVTAEEAAAYYTSSENIDYNSLVATLKKMRGATRVSVGIATVKRDLDNFFDFLKTLLDQPCQ